MTKMVILDPMTMKRIEITDDQDRRARKKAVEENIWYHNALRQILKEDAFKKFEGDDEQ